MSDSETTVDLLKNKVASFVKVREWEQFHNPKDLSMSISIEAAELMELFQWKTLNEVETIKSNPKAMAEIKDEVADIIIYSLSLANALDIDVSEAIEQKIKKNEEKYPVHKAKGTSKKYTEL